MKIDEIEKLNEFEFPDSTEVDYDRNGDVYPQPLPSTKNLVHMIDKINEIITTVNMLSDAINNIKK